MNTTYFLNCIAGNVFHTKSNPAIPASYYLGLSQTTPKVDGSGVTEPSVSAGYKRVKIESLDAPVDGVVINHDPVSFEESTGNWGCVTHFVIYDTEDVGTGNLLMFDELKTHRNIETETIMVVREGYLRLLVQNPSA